LFQTPCAEGYSPEKKDARDGQQCGDGQRMFVKITLSRLSASRLGVLQRLKGGAVSYLWWSVIKIRTLGFFIAVLSSFRRMRSPILYNHITLSSKRKLALAEPMPRAGTFIFGQYHPRLIHLSETI
jgi:hypothetical protein